MATTSREAFLQRIHLDAAVQRQLQDATVREVAVAIARAAGFAVTAADLLAGGARTTSAPLEAESIDFDGDGIPDAVCVDGEWIFQSEDD